MAIKAAATAAREQTPAATGEGRQEMAAAPEIHLAEQARLLREIIHMMVGIEVEAAPRAWPPEGEDLVQAVVRFTGPWAGAMIFESTLPLSFEFTARFMAVPLPAAIDDDVRDAHGELANMIAGNFKALLPPGSQLSIPDVRLRQCAGQRAVSSPARHGTKALSELVFRTAHGGCCLVLADIGPQAESAG